MMGMMGGDQMRASMLGTGVFYRFKRGDDEVDIHCPSNMPVQDCVNGATTIMSSLRQNQSPTGGNRPGQP